MSRPPVPRQRTTTVTTAMLGLLVVALATLTVWTSVDVSRSSERSNSDLAVDAIYEDIRTAVADEGVAGQSFRDRPAVARRELAAARTRLRRSVAELRAHGSRGDLAIAPYIVANELRYQWGARELFAAAARSDRRGAERIMETEMTPAYRTIQRLVDLAARVHRDRALKATSDVSRRSARFAGIVVLAYAVGLLLLGACAYFLVRLQTAMRDLVARQHHLARHDPLTGLPNRLQWHETTEAGWGTSASAAVLLIDLDAFKHVNDTLGHDQGDAMLEEVARRLKATLRSDDLIARLGGDEFAVLLPATDRAGALQAAHKIRAALSGPCRLGDHDLCPQGSIGIALAPDHGTDGHTLLRHADQAMYAAKTDRGGPRIFDAGLSAPVASC